MTSVSRFLGDSPLRVLVKLVVISFLAGLVMNAFGWWPADVVVWVRDALLSIWYSGFDALERGLSYILLGAVIVVPVFILIRLFRMNGRG